jgi:hypothetical protein
MFALAFYDKNGNLIDTIGPSTSPFTLALPLPKLQCQAYVALTAHKLGCPKEALSAARPGIAHFVEHVAVDEDGVERLFGDRLRVKAARESPTTLLRSFVQVNERCLYPALRRLSITSKISFNLAPLPFLEYFLKLVE